MNNISMSFECNNIGISKLAQMFFKKCRIPRKTKKFYKREYGVNWKLNYDVHKGNMDIAVKDKDDKTTILPRNVHIVPLELQNKPKGRWKN